MKKFFTFGMIIQFVLFSIKKYVRHVTRRVRRWARRFLWLVGAMRTATPHVTTRVKGTMLKVGDRARHARGLHGVHRTE